MGDLFAASSWQFFVKRGQRDVVQGVGSFGSRLWECLKESYVVVPGFSALQRKKAQVGEQISLAFNVFVTPRC